MFNRLQQTYDVKPGVVQNILADEASPLNRIARLVFDNAKILDIGAGNGLLAQVLRKVHPQLTIDGIEPDPYAAEIAGKYYRNFYCGYAQDFKEKILSERYDFIVLADVIEHMSNPAEFLQELSKGLPLQTKIILTIPNVAFGTVRMSLLCGKFDYCDSGILERTHLRFFTLQTINTLIAQLDMHAEKIFFLQRELFATEIKVQQLGLHLFSLHKILRDPLSSTYQFLVVLSKGKTVTEQKNFGKKTRLPLIAFIVAKLKDYLK